MTDHRVAFTLRDDYAGDVDVVDEKNQPTGETRPRYVGGVVTIGDDTLDLAEALEAGGGVIVVDPATDPLALVVLDERPELRRVAVPEDANAADTLEALTVPKLKDRALGLGLAVASNATKPVLIAAIPPASELRARGVDTTGVDAAELAGVAGRPELAEVADRDALDALLNPSQED